MINIKQIETFVRVAEEENFTKAAKALYMTQPAVSFQIKALEEHFQCQLFERLEKRVEITEAGRLFYPEAKNILAAYERAKEAIIELQGLARGTVSLGASTIPGEYLLPLLIGSFKARYPGLQVNLQITDSSQVVENVLARKLDIGVVGAVFPAEALAYRPFIEDEIIFIAPPGHPLAGKERSIKDLASAPLILRESGSGTRKVILERLARHNLALEDLKVIMEVGSTRAVITAVEGGLGIGVVSRWAAKEALELGLVKEVKIAGFQGKRDLFVVTCNCKYLGKAAKTFLEFLESYRQTVRI